MNAGFSCDAAGNMTSNPLQSGIVYTAENKMMQAGAGTAVYRYGPDGQWAMRGLSIASGDLYQVAVNTDAWFHVRDPFGRLRYVMRYRDKGAAGADWVVDKQFNYFLDRMQEAGTLMWYGRDRLGSVRATLRQNGYTNWEVTQRLSYFPYGQERGVESDNDT
jgi:hypothetical protein